MAAEGTAPRVLCVSCTAQVEAIAANDDWCVCTAAHKRETSLWGEYIHKYPRSREEARDLSGLSDSACVCCRDPDACSFSSLPLALTNRIPSHTIRRPSTTPTQQHHATNHRRTRETSWVGRANLRHCLAGLHPRTGWWNAPPTFSLSLSLCLSPSNGHSSTTAVYL